MTDHITLSREQAGEIFKAICFCVAGCQELRSVFTSAQADAVEQEWHAAEAR